MQLDHDIDCLARSFDDRELLASVNNDLVVVDPMAQQVRRRMASHTSTLTAIATNPAPPLVASAGKDRRLVLWNMASERPVFTSVSAEDRLYSACFSPDGRTLVTGQGNSMAQFWHLPTRQLLMEPKLGWIEELAVSPDGKRLAFRLNNGQVFLTGVRVPIQRRPPVTPPLSDAP